MSKKLVCFFLVLSFCFVSSGNAANIIWVSDWYDELADGVPDDQKFVEVLEGHGHTVDNQEAPSFGSGYWRNMNADKLAALNAADLVILSRNSNSGDYSNDIDFWNSITTPFIIMTPYFSRDNRWQWVNNNDLAGDGSTPTLQAVNAAHPVFIGVDLNTKNQVDIYDQTVGSGTVSFYDSIDLGNGTLIATPVDQERTIIAEWEAGVEFYPGSGLTTAGRRMLLFMGTREGVGFGRGEYNLNAEGEKIFLNAIDYMLGILKRFKAHSPIPADGALHTDTWANLSWSVGDTAASHDVYFGDNFNDVNDGTVETLLGNQTATLITLGFPGFAIPDGLVPGTTYYWRVDEVEADGATKHKGDVWSFLVPPKTAYNPIPLDGAKFIDQNVDLEWSPGSGAKFHTVYFSDNFNDVNNATGGQAQVGTSFDPGSLEIGKLYYWRVDEDDLIETHKGNVWSFTTIRPGGGIRAQYYRGIGFGGSPVINTKDANINFNWAGDSPDPSLEVDSFSVRWTGELEVEFSEAYTFYANTDDGVRLWVNDQLIINRWVDRRAPTEAKGTVELIGGQRVPFIMEYYESGGDAVAELRWESPSLPKQLIPDAAFSLPVKASGSNPSTGAV
ncbi:MAG: PA14 domain-containing protein, partial [Planctomycetota bacterium]